MMGRSLLRLLLEIYKLDMMKKSDFDLESFERFAEYVELYICLYDDIDELLSKMRSNILYLPSNSFEYARSFIFYVDKMIR